MAPQKNILITGAPGVGKTTVITRVVSLIGSELTKGFYTQEMRSGGQRLGFQIITLKGEKAVLSHVDYPGPPRVGRYGVDVAALERVALPSLEREDRCLLVIDEIGKMECLSRAFREAVLAALEAPGPVLATIGTGGPDFIESLKARPDCRVMQVTRANREHLPEEIAKLVRGYLAGT